MQSRVWLSGVIAIGIHAMLWYGWQTSWSWPMVAVESRDVTPLMKFLTLPALQLSVHPTAEISQADLISAAANTSASHRVAYAASPATPLTSIRIAQQTSSVHAGMQPNQGTRSDNHAGLGAAVPPNPLAEAVIQKRSSVQSVASVGVEQALSIAALKKVADDYRMMVYQRIAELRDYPALAKGLSQEGTVLIRFTILADGDITQVTVVESSGYELLDNAALQIFSRGLAYRLPPIPAALDKKRWVLSIPIRYQLAIDG